MKQKTKNILTIVGAVILIIINIYLFNYAPKDQTVEDISNACTVNSRVSINGYVFNCSLAGMKIPTTLPSGTKTTIYKEFK